MAQVNDVPDAPVAIPAYTPETAADPRPWLAGLGVSLVLLMVALLSPSLDSGSWVGALLRAFALMALAGSAAGTFSAALLKVKPPTLAFLPAVLGGAAMLIIFAIVRPSDQDRAAELATFRRDLLAGQMPEARAFIGQGGELPAPLVDALYEAGARRVFAWDHDEDGEADWLGIDMPLLPARRSAVAAALRAGVSDISDVPSTMLSPGSEQHWIVPLPD